MDTNVSQLWHLSPDFVPATQVVRPDSQALPLVFGLPHSGRYYPQSFVNAARGDLLTLRSTEDAFVDELIDFSQGLGVAGVRATYGRAFVDVNRDPRELDARLIKGMLPVDALTQTLRVKSGYGVIPRCLSGQQEIYRHPIGFDEAKTRIERVHSAYHQALSELLQEALADFKKIVFIDWHSMPSSVLSAAHPQRKLPDIVLGDLYGETCNAELTRFVKKQFEAQGLRVGLNMPFAGGYTMELYGQPHKGIHGLQVEINRALYMNEKRLEITSGFEALKSSIGLVIESLKDFRLT